MASIASSNSRRRLLAWCAVLSVVFLIARFIYGRNRPEELGEVPLSFNRLLRNGQYYWTQQAMPNIGFVPFALYTQPVHGGEPRTLFEISDPALTVDSAFQSGDYFYYTTRQVEKIPVATAGGSYGGGVTVKNPPRDLGNFLLEPNPKTFPGEVRKASQRFTSGSGPSRPAPLHRIRFNGGSPETLPGTVPAKSTFQIIGEKIYWLDYREGEMVQVWKGNAFRTELREPNVLRERDLKTGTTRTVATDIGRLLEGDGARIYWKRLRPYPDKRTDLYSFSPQDGKIVCLPNYETDRTPVEKEGRFYWIENSLPNLPATSVRSPAAALVCARPDGSERRTLLTLPDDKSFVFFGSNALYGYRGEVYLDCAKPSVSSSASVQASWKSDRFLARLYPERAELVEKLVSLPEGIQSIFLEDDYVYFYRQEEREEWWAWFSLNNRMRSQAIWYRLRLPSP